MDAERYARVRELFLAVEELPSDQQYAFLQANCDGDAELLGEVASLLEEHDPESAITEGDSAKQPAFPSSTELDPGQRSSEDTDSGHSLAAVASPFLPPSSHDGDDSLAGIDADESDQQRREQSTMIPNQIGRKRRKPSSRKSPGPKDTAKIGSEANSAQETQHSSQRTHATPRYPDDSPLPKRQPSPNLWQTNSKKHRRFNSGWLWFAAVLPTALVGWWTYSKVSESLREATAHELAAVADSVDLGVSQFLDDQARLTQSWSRQPDLRNAVMALVETASQQGDSETLRNSPHATEIRSQLIALSQSPDIKYVVWDRTGTIIASWLEDGGDIGSTVAPEGAGNLARAMRGETVLFGPAILQSDVSGFTPETDLPVMAEIMPVRNESDRVIATMLIRGFGMFDAFDSIFQRASQAGGLDVYAVDRAGTMVTNSPAAVDLIQTHPKTIRMTGESGKHLIDESNWTPPPLVACVLRVSDPGDDTNSDGLGTQNRQRQSLTYSVAGAVSGGDDVRLEPYRNYAGLNVVGAWRWVALFGS